MLISRKEWGATPSPPSALLSGWTGVWAIHWRDSVAVGDRDGASLMRGAEHYQEETKGWRDIAYHVGGSRDGLLYQGRDLGFQGAATYGHNTYTMAFVFLLGKGELTEQAIESCRNFLHVEAPLLGFPFKAAFPHSDFRNTECCGDDIREAMPLINTPIAKKIETVEVDDMSKIVMDLSGVQNYVDRSYALAGREPGNDLQGRRFWVRNAIAADEPMTSLDTMDALLYRAAAA